MLSRKYYLFSIVILIVIWVMMFSGCTNASKNENMIFNSISEIEATIIDKTLFATLEKDDYFFLLSYCKYNDSYLFNILDVKKKGDNKMQIISGGSFTFAIDSQDNFIEPKELTVSRELEGFIVEFSFLDINSKNYENSGDDFSKKVETMQEISGLSGVYYSCVFSN